MQFGFDLFSDIFTYRNNALTRMNSRVKVVVGILAILGVISSSKIYFPLGVFLCCTAGVIAVRLPLRLVFMRLAAPLGMVLVLFIVQSVLVGSTPIFTISFWQWRISVMEEGVRHGILIGCRALSAVCVLVLMSSVTPAHQLFHCLRWLGIPKGWVEVAMLMYRYTFAILDRASDVMVAQRVRLGYSNPRRSLSSLGDLAGIVIVHSMDQAERTHEAMKMRGYNGSIPFGPLPEITGRERWIMGVASGFLLAAYILFEWGYS